MKQRINLLQFIVGGMLKKKNEGGFCSLSTKVYINNFPSRPSVVLVQTTPAFVSQILLHMTFDQSPQISSSKGKKKVRNTTALQSCPRSSAAWWLLCTFVQLEDFPYKNSPNLL